MTFCCFQPIVNEDLLDKILPTILSSTIIILLFIIGRLIDARLKHRETKNNWYMKVILEPNIKKLDEFYNNTLESIKESTIMLAKAQAENVSINDYSTIRTTQIGKFQSIKRKFEFEFIDIVKVNCPEIADALSDKVRTIEDIGTLFLDSRTMAAQQYDSIEADINKTKPELLKLLYEPLRYRKVSLRRTFFYCFSFLRSKKHVNK